MALYLFKVSLKAKGVPLNYRGAKQKPVYIVSGSKDEAISMASSRIHDHLEVRSVTKIAEHLSPYIFSAA